MNIALITPTLNYGGGEKQIEFLALSLARRGHSVSVYCFFDEGPIAVTLTNAGINVRGLYSRFLSGSNIHESRKDFSRDKSVFRKSGNLIDRCKRALNEFIASFRLLCIFIKNKPDVAHLYQNQAKMAILAAKIAGVKKIIYTETSLIGDWLTPNQLNVMKFFWKYCDCLIALSEAMKKHLIGLKAADIDKIYLVPTMLPLPKNVLKEAYRDNKKSINIGIIGRLTPEKGHIFFLEAARLIVKKHQGIRFIIAGDGYLKNELINATEKLGISENVEFTGAFKDISDIMSRIDILALSSLTEGLPLVLLEGMAHGKPIVATDVGGVSELILEDKTGFIVASKDSKALADAILKLVNDPQKRKKFADEAVMRFKEKYSSKILIPMIESIYRGGKN